MIRLDKGLAKWARKGGDLEMNRRKLIVLMLVLVVLVFSVAVAPAALGAEAKAGDDVLAKTDPAPYAKAGKVEAKA
jgi:flagellar basal body-associated protein FliL